MGERFEGVTMARSRGRPPRGGVVTWETVRQLARVLPEATEGTSYGTPAFKVRGTLFVRLHQDGDAVVVKIDTGERATRMRTDPETYFITDHYRDYPLMLVRLASVSPEDLGDLLEESWRRSAPKRLLARHASGK